MANTSLPDLTERTATSDSDLIHVNSGGSDYKQTKANFTSDLAKEISFSTSSTLTSQIDALNPGAYYGFILSYGHQTATGMPYDVNFFVNVQKYDSNNCTVHAIARGTNSRKWTINKANSWGSWIEDPSRDEISALNNSLANIRTNGQFLGYRDKYTTNISISYDNSYAKIGDVYDDFGIPSGAYVISFNIRGWSGASGTLMLTTGSDGRTIYVMSNKAGTIGSITVRVWYAILN